jgi:crossover junction endodeoxyribonuclease RuvC
MGIDPGYAIVGYGIVKYENNNFKALDFGCIKTSPLTLFEQRLLEINEGIAALRDKYSPSAIAVEKLFFNENTKTAIDVAQGRGAILLTAAQSLLPVFEYTPLEVKMAVTGYGRADKNQIQQMVKTILNLPKAPKPDDAADALAVAICHAHSYKMKSGIFTALI